ncbi:MAG: flavodoxin domain-containing protein [Anaerolineae bacterium]|nr:flavodoxin domain-containing protein [Anaerolineae bacterium]
MSDLVLVTYASRTGFTVGVAEAIGQTLAENGLQVEVVPMKEIKNLTPYRAVVTGSAIRSGQWLPEALDFVQTHRSALTRQPFAAFLVCMTLAMKNPQYHAGVKDWLQPVRTLVKPISEGYFAGGLDISKVPSWGDRMKFRLSVALGVWSEGDHRDWNAVRAWSNNLFQQLSTR